MKSNIIIIILLAGLIIIEILNYSKVQRPETSKEIDSLQVKIEQLSNLNTSLNDSIDSLKALKNKVDLSIIRINERYEKDFDSIISQSVASDVQYFTEYLSENSTRLLNSNNSNTVKGN